MAAIPAASAAAQTTGQNARRGRRGVTTAGEGCLPASSAIRDISAALTEGGGGSADSAARPTREDSNSLSADVASGSPDRSRDSKRTRSSPSSPPRAYIA